MLLINAFFVTIQYISGYSLDSAIGLFSSGNKIAGGSAGMNVLMCIVTVYAILSYLNKDKLLYFMIISLVLCIYISALAEIKVYYFEFVMIVVLVAIVTKMSLKKIIVIFIIGIVLLYGINLYNQYYGSGYYYTSRGVSFFSLEAISEYIGLDGSSYGRFNSLNRVTAVPYVWDNFLITLPNKLFGLGVGYGDSVSSSLFSSGFLSNNSGLGYQFWTVSLELTNIGLIGLLLCFSLFIAVYVENIRAKKMMVRSNTLIQTSQICTLIFIILMFYNQSFILDIAAPFMFFVMSIPYILINEKKRFRRN